MRDDRSKGSDEQSGVSRREFLKISSISVAVPLLNTPPPEALPLLTALLPLTVQSVSVVVLLPPPYTPPPR